MTFSSGQQLAHFTRATIGIVAVICLLIVVQPGNAPAQDSTTPTSTAPPPKIAATVNDVAITVENVNRELGRTISDVKLSPAKQQALQKATLEKMINQAVVLHFLAELGQAAEPVEIELQIAELTAELETVEKSIDDYCQQTNLTLNELRQQISWQISWKRYLDQKLSDSFLEEYFARRKRQFDGTEIRVAHLLLKRPENATAAQLMALMEKAEQIAVELASPSLSFESAVRSHSDAPTKNASGEIGWIGIDGPMPDAFTIAAFKLNVADISPPVTTKFGVHLIMCMEVKEGTLAWRDVLSDVKKSASLELFREIATQHRPKLKIKYLDDFQN